MKEPTWQNVKYDPINYQDIVYYSAPKKKKALNSLDEVDPEVKRDVRQARDPDRGAEAARRRRGRRGVRQRLGRDDVPREAEGRTAIIFMSFSEAVREHPGAGEEVPRLGRAVLRQLLRRAELRGLQRRLVRLHPEGRPLPDGAVDLLPDQREGHRPVRADADHRRRGRVRQLPRRLHGADARREPAARRGRRARGARRRDDQVLDDPELVSRRQGRQGRDLQLRDQARALRRPRVEDHLDAGRDRLGDHLEVSRAASCRATTRSASSTRSRRPTTGSRPTPARR